MLEVKGELWDYPTWGLCITTNGYVKATGRAVMGRGCALEAKQRIPGIDIILANKINDFGNHVHRLCISGGKFIYSFPVKHSWWEEADIELIKRSCVELQAEIKDHVVLLPRPGCGNGRLKWEVVRPIISPLLRDNVVVISK